MTIMPFDELNAFKEQLPIHFDADGHIRSKQDEEDIIDELLDLFLLAYANGVEDVNTSLGSFVEPPLSNVMDTVDREIAGKTWRERVHEYAETVALSVTSFGLPRLKPIVTATRQHIRLR